MFDVRICKCGRIHFIQKSLIQEALEKDKDIMLVCGGCGLITMIGADRTFDYDFSDEEMYNMYAFDVNESMLIDRSVFDGDKHRKGIHKIVYSQGKRVMMNTGYFATSYWCGKFLDNCYPDFHEIERGNITAKEVFDFLEKWRENRQTVRMNMLLNELTDDEAEALSHYYIKGLDWKGTKFEKEWC